MVWNYKRKTMKCSYEANKLQNTLIIFKKMEGLRGAAPHNHLGESPSGKREEVLAWP